MSRSEGPSLNWVDVVLLGVSASFWPLWIVGSNYAGIAHFERVLAIILGVWGLSVVLVWLLNRRGFPAKPAVHSTFITVVLLMSGGALMRSLGILPAIAAIVTIIALAFFVFYRFGNSTTARAVVVALAVAIASGPLIVGYETWSNLGEDEVVAAAPLDVQLSAAPDIFLVVLDGYPGIQAMRQDLGSPNTDLISGLTDRGFEVPTSVWSSYWTTQLAVASILDLGHPLVNEWEGHVTEQRLYDKIGGDNVLRATLEANGYETYMVESGWSGSGCDDDYFDHCVASPIVDESVFLILRNTAATPLVDRTGGPFTQGALSAMDWLKENGPSISRSSEPEFVFAHFVAPHPPFFLDAMCQKDVTYARSGITFYLSGVPNDERVSHFLDQAGCLDRFMLDFADLVEGDDVVVFVADHGTDRRFQLDMAGEEWGHEELVERMNVLAAVRSVPGCSVGDGLLTANLLRRVLGCYSAIPIQDQPDRMWVKSMYEIDASVVEGLLAADE